MEIEKQGIAKINIYESEEHGMIGQTLIKQLSNTDEFSIVIQSLKTASKRQGMSNTSTPNYDFVIELKNKNSYSFHYWLQEADHLRGLLANISDLETDNVISDKSTQQLLQLLDS